VSWWEEPTQARTVLVNVTYQVEVTVVHPGQDDRPLDVQTQRDAEMVVHDALLARDWGGYTMLGKAFSRAKLSGWDAVSVKIAHKRRSTEADRQRLERDEKSVRIGKMMADKWEADHN
jgi:hypothetical protein